MNLTQYIYGGLMPDLEVAPGALQMECQFDCVGIAGVNT